MGSLSAAQIWRIPKSVTRDRSCGTRVFVRGMGMWESRATGPAVAAWFQENSGAGNRYKGAITAKRILLKMAQQGTA